MFLGIPYVPFFIVAGGCLLFAMYFNLFFLLTLPVVMFVMRQMARRDEMVFRLIGLRWQFKFRAMDKRRHPGLWVFSPNTYRQKQASS